jgi:hypothetical protein
MDGAHLLWTIFEWLPLVFAVDLVAFHLTGDHPLALRWWCGRRAPVELMQPEPLP